LNFTSEEGINDEIEESCMISRISKPENISDIEYHIKKYSLNLNP